MLCCWNGLLFRAIVVANNAVVVSREVGWRVFGGLGSGCFGTLGWESSDYYSCSNRVRLYNGTSHLLPLYLACQRQRWSAVARLISMTYAARTCKLPGLGQLGRKHSKPPLSSIRALTLSN